MARLFWASAACLAAIAAPLSLSAKTSSTAQATPSSSPVATAVNTVAPTPAPSPVPTAVPSPVATAKATPVAATSTAKSSELSPTAKANDGHKSAALAEIIAIVPGVVVHGAGHMYAGSWMKGLGLFALEGGSVYELLQVRGHGNFQALGNQMSNGKIPTDLSGAETDAGIALVAGFGFLWAWFDDISGAGVAVDEYNKRQDQGTASHAQLQMLPVQGGAMLALNTRF